MPVKGAASVTAKRKNAGAPQKRNERPARSGPALAQAETRDSAKKAASDAGQRDRAASASKAHTQQVAAKKKASSELPGDARQRSSAWANLLFAPTVAASTASTGLGSAVVTAANSAAAGGAAAFDSLFGVKAQAEDGGELSPPPVSGNETTSPEGADHVNAYFNQNDLGPYGLEGYDQVGAPLVRTLDILRRNPKKLGAWFKANRWELGPAEDKVLYTKYTATTPAGPLVLSWDFQGDKLASAKMGLPSEKVVHELKYGDELKRPELSLQKSFSQYDDRLMNPMKALRDGGGFNDTDFIVGESAFTQEDKEVKESFDPKGIDGNGRKLYVNDTGKLQQSLFYPNEMSTTADTTIESIVFEDPEDLDTKERREIDTLTVDYTPPESSKESAVFQVRRSLVL